MHAIRILLTFFAISFTAITAGAADISSYPEGIAASGIGGSRHNMGATGKVITTGSTTEICVFCHTPHFANTGDNGIGPLWNKRIVPTTYTAYGTTMGGNTVSTVSGASLACLSCHDGTTTFDNLVNLPGKDGITFGGSGSDSNRSWAFGMPSPFITPNVLLDHFYVGGVSCDDCHSSGADKAQNVLRFIVGTNLSNDHPVSVPYTTTVASLRPVNTVIGTINISADLNADAATAYGGNLLQNRWSVNGFITSGASISDILRDGKVECTSCHDPHFNNLSWDETESTWADGLKTDWCNDEGEACSDGMFLRRVGGNTGSALCRTCHEK